MVIMAPLLIVSADAVGVHGCNGGIGKFRTLVDSHVIHSVGSHKDAGYVAVCIVRSPKGRAVKDSVRSAVGRKTAGTAEGDFAPFAFSLKQGLTAEGFTFEGGVTGVGVKALFQDKSDGVAVAEVFGSFNAETASGVDAVVNSYFSGFVFVFCNGNCLVDNTVERNVGFCSSFWNDSKRGFGSKERSANARKKL